MRRVHSLHRHGSQHGRISTVQRRKGKEICASQCGDYDSPAFRRRPGAGDRHQIVADHILRTKKKLNEILAANTGQPIEVIERDTERDNYMSALEAKEYGLVDAVIANH